MPRSKWLIWGTIVGLLLCSGMPLLSQHITLATSSLMTISNTMPVGSSPPQLAHSQVLGHVDAQHSLSLSVNLSLHNLPVLQQYLQGVYTPGSYLYHHYLRPADFATLYGPSAHDVQQVSSYLQAQGFTVTYAAAGQQVIDFSGSVAQVERAFGVQINSYRATDGRTFYANTVAPHVPVALHQLIQHINGLSSVALRQHPPLHQQPLLARQSPHAVACPGNGSSAAQYYTPAQFATAYNFSGLYNAGYHGEGQSVALFELDSFTPADISSYRVCFASNSTATIKTTLIDGGPANQGPGGLEVELDMDVLLGMLPHLANLAVYEAPNTDTGYNDQWMRILQDDIPVVSTSWGMCEPGLTAADVAAEQQFFMQAAAQGQTLLAASGDNGAYDCGTATLAVDDPASNPYVTGVGGTRLALNSDNSYKSESAWSNSPTTGYATGGGVSQLWSMPSYQSGPGVVSSASSGVPCHAAKGSYCREVPDVSVNADPNTGYVVYCTIASAGCQASAPFVHIGGTSAAAPMWAAATVLANQYALAHSGANLGFLNPAIYTLLNSASLNGRAFHDVTGGTNFYYTATAGYDMVTGVGTFNAYGFVLAIVSLPGATTIPSSTRWYFAEGHVGSGFQEYLTLENPAANSVAQVSVNYLLHGRAGLSARLTLNPNSRMTVDVNRFLQVDRASAAGQDVAVFISSDTPIVAERPIYFTFAGTTAGGSDAVGTTHPGQHFTFANGETLAGYSTFITVLNPLGQTQATVTASYYSGGVKIGQSVLTVPSGQRNTISANGSLSGGQQFLIQVDSDQPVVVERPLYFRTSVPGIAGTVTGGSSVLGVAPATSWYFPDGYTGGQGVPSRENLILANSDVNGTGTAATVTVTYALSNGTIKTVNLVVPVKSQVIEYVNADVGAGTLVAMKVLSTNGIGIVAERQQFFSFPALAPTPTGVEVVGVTPGTQGLASIYSFAEGHIGDSFSEYVTLFNPNSSAMRVSVTYFVTRGTMHTVAQQQVTIAAMGVAQLNANTFLNIPASGGGAADTSLVVQSLPDSNGTVLPVVAERSLYFNFGGNVPGSTSVMGYSGM